MATDWSTVEELVGTIESASGGTVGIAVIGPNGERWSHNGDRQFRAASTMKIPLMIEIYRQIDRGERALDDPYTLTADDKAIGSGVLLHLHDGIGITLKDIIYLMISISDNTATNILIDMAGMDEVNALMRELGMPNSTLGRKMKGRPAVEGEKENFATPNDYAAVVAALFDGSAASSGSCDAMIEMLTLQQNSRRIPRYLPESDDIRWGTKTGSITGVTNDVGFVETPTGRIIIAAFCEDFPDQHDGEFAIGELSRAAMHACGLWPSEDAPAS